MSGGSARRPIAATYRLQLRPEFTFDDAAAVAPYLADLGVTHLYLSPILQAAPGSAHGYDVVDHSRLNAELGGDDGFDRLAAAARAAGLGIVVDVVPNHVAIPTPASLNPVLWSVLRDGPAAPEARWFDVDWSVERRALLMPVLGDPIGRCLSRGEIHLDRSGDEPLVRYFDHVLPVRPGTEDLPLPELLDRQWYRLAHWRVAAEELNYRRFFDVDTLAGIRMEVPEVFEATHRLLVQRHAAGDVDGFRIDHPDGLADPRGYLRDLAAATGGAWTVVEKILEGEEHLPEDWACAGTTGYDALNRVMGALVDPAGAEPLTAVWLELAGGPRAFEDCAEEAKRQNLAGTLHAEVNRLADLAAEICQDDIMLRDHTRRGIEEALVELLVAFDVYRAYVRPGRAALARGARARRARGGARPRARARPRRRGGAGGRLRPRPARARRPARRVLRALSADHRSRHGQGRRGHGLLPLPAPGRVERGGRRSRHARRRARPPARLGRGPAGAPPARHDRPQHARHEALGGRAGTARGPVRAGRRRARRGRSRGRRRSGGCGPATPRTRPTCTCSGRRWSAPGRSTWTGSAPTWRRPFARPSCAPLGEPGPRLRGGAGRPGGRARSTTRRRGGASRRWWRGWRRRPGATSSRRSCCS